MNEMERGTICEMDLQGRIRGMSYGQYVAAKYYPVTVVEELPGGGEIVRRAALPEVLPGYEETAARIRSADAPARPKKPKRERLCAVCGSSLPEGKKKYCSEECKEEAAEDRKRRRRAAGIPAERVDKPCTVCGRIMRQVLKAHVYCSPECRRLGNNRRQREWNARNASAPKAPRHCRICGTAIEGGGYKYCPDCAAAENARRNRERWKRRNHEE